jgi:hypothetical protein
MEPATRPALLENFAGEALSSSVPASSRTPTNSREPGTPRTQVHDGLVCAATNCGFCDSIALYEKTETRLQPQEAHDLRHARHARH